MDFMICFLKSVRVVQFAKKSRLFIRSFVRSVVFPVAVNHSVSRSDSLPPSVPRSHSRIANASRVVQTHFLPPPLVLIRECQPSRSDSLPPSIPRSRSRIANASRVGQTWLLPRSQHSNESRKHNAVLTAESVSVRLPRCHFSNESRNHDSQSCNGANGYQSTQH